MYHRFYVYVKWKERTRVFCRGGEGASTQPPKPKIPLNTMVNEDLDGEIFWMSIEYMTAQLYC
jgi:hypothetical protein